MAQADEFDKRSYPEQGYDPAQFNPESFNLPLGFIDWWSPCSTCCLPCFPCLSCIKGRCNPCLVSRVDAADPIIWQKTLQTPTDCPESMNGVWWMQDNIAAESLVCVNDSRWVQDGDNPDRWGLRHELPQTWSRDYSAFGYVLGAANSLKGVVYEPQTFNPNRSPWDTWVSFRFDLDQGKAILNPKESVYRINEDEWQKASYAGDYDSPDRDKVTYMYRWRRIIRGDGTKTPAFDEMEKIFKGPLPHRNCLEPWCCLWPLCISKADRLRDMAHHNRKQLIIWRPEHREPICDLWCLTCRCPVMCPLAAKVDRKYKPLEQAPSPQTMGI